jgi:hypothetical protein
LRAMEGQGNPWGQPASAPARLDAAARVPGPARSPRCQAAASWTSSEVLTGSAARPAFDPRNQKVGPRRSRRACTPPGVSFAVPRPGGVVHGRPGPSDGQRLRLPDPRVGQRRDARPLRDGGADDRDRVPALLQHDRQRVRAAGRVVQDRPPLDVPGGARVIRASCDRAGEAGSEPGTIGRGASPSTTRAIWPATTT